MNYSSEFYGWINDALFILGLLLLPVGLTFCFKPDKMFTMAKSMNKWVTTDNFFNKVNKPIYQESFFYRHHQLFGITVIVASITSLYMLVFHIGIEPVTGILVRMAESEFEKWLFVILYYILISTTVLVIVFGVIMIARPSTLKVFENWSNRWIDTDTPLKSLDKQNNVPDKILPGNPRIFGIVIILAAIYIIFSTST